MISVYKLKPKFQQLLMPLLNMLYRFGVTANQITISSIILSLIIGILFWYSDHNKWFFLALPIGLFIRMALNALDGMMARIYQQQSKTGEILNEVGDVVSDIMIFFPLLKFQPQQQYLIVIFLCLTIINEFAGVLAKTVAGQRRYDGPMGKSDRAFIFGVYGLLCFLNINLSGIMSYILVLIIALLILSTSIRVYRSLK